MNLTIEPSVTILTPSVSSEHLPKCMSSVQNQSFRNLKHLIVFDGRDAYEKFKSSESDIVPTNKRTVHINFLEENVGSNGFYGHRIYAAYSHLIDSDYVVFLDEDNWIEPDHVQSLVKLCEEKNLHWTHSLRNIMDEDGNFMDQDNCESLGAYPIYFTFNQRELVYLVDTSSYCFRTDFLKTYGHFWHYGWGADRRFLQIMKEVASRFECTGKYTLNYRLSNIEKKYGSKYFFKNGNEFMLEHYNGEYPWQRN